MQIIRDHIKTFKKCVWMQSAIVEQCISCMHLNKSSHNAICSLKSLKFSDFLIIMKKIRRFRKKLISNNKLMKYLWQLPTHNRPFHCIIIGKCHVWSIFVTLNQVDSKFMSTNCQTRTKLRMGMGKSSLTLHHSYLYENTFILTTALSSLSLFKLCFLAFEEYLYEGCYFIIHNTV